MWVSHVCTCLCGQTLIADESSQESVSLPPAQGPHWERIGFQGLDPRTDVNRSMKMFAVLQVWFRCVANVMLCHMLFFGYLIDEPFYGY